MGEKEKGYTITIASGTIIRTLLFLLLAAGVYFFWDLVLVVFMAIVIASAAEPAIKALCRLKIPRLLAVMVIYIVCIAGVGALLFFFIPSVLEDAASFLTTIPTSFNTKDILGPFIDNNSSVAYSGIENFSASFSLSDIVDNFRTTLAQSSTGLLSVARAIFGSIMSFVLVIVLSFYFSVQKNGVENFLRIVVPIQHEQYVIDLWKRSQYKIGRWMQGQFVLALVVGVLVYLGLMIFNVKHALLLALLAAVFEIIPVFGPILAAIPAVLLSFVEGGPTAALLIAGFYTLVQQFENHLIYPLVVRKVVGVPPLVVILALIIGVRLAGFLGALLSVPVTATLLEFVHDIERSRSEAQKRLKEET